MKKLFWKSYYKFILGKNYEAELESAKRLSKTIIGSTQGKISHFHNIQGDKIRGYQEPRIRFSNIPDKHPLELKYL